ncbi:hypothetical protein BH23PAT2_BH23PAT2_05630 [soil metagenome]
MIEPTNTPLRFINRKNIFLFIVFLLLLGGFYWFSTHAFIEIVVENPVNDKDIDYQLEAYGQEARQSTTKDATIKKLVRKDNYQVTIKHADKSYFAIARTGGFLGTTSVSASLVAERGRTFIGNNPKLCMHYASELLFSWQCQGRVADSAVHVPASPSIPSLTRPFTTSGEPSIVEALLSEDGSNYALTKVSDVHETIHVLYPFELKSKLLSLNEPRVLSNLSGNRSYGIMPYRAGSLVFSNDGEDLFYYESFNNKPEQLESAKPQTQGLEFYGVDTFGDAVALTYNQHNIAEYEAGSYVLPSYVLANEFIEHEDEGEESHAAPPLEATEVIVLSGGETEHYVFDFAAQQVRLCGDNRLCVLHGTSLDIYEVSNGKADKLYTIEGVEQIENSAKGLLLVKDDGVLVFDTVKRAGYVEYSFGGYDFCGIESASEVYIICISTGGGKMALLMNQSEIVVDEIDKQVLSLLQLPETKTVSPYGRLIYISPELGGLVFNEEIDGFDYDPGVKQAVNRKINQEIDKLNINRKIYQVINPYQ